MFERFNNIYDQVIQSRWLSFVILNVVHSYLYDSITWVVKNELKPVLNSQQYPKTNKMLKYQNVLVDNFRNRFFIN